MTTTITNPPIKAIFALSIPFANQNKIKVNLKNISYSNTIMNRQT